MVFYVMDFETCTELAEAAANSVDHDEWLDDETHPVWDWAVYYWNWAVYYMEEDEPC